MPNKSVVEHTIKIGEQKANNSYESCEIPEHLYALPNRYYGDAQPRAVYNSTQTELNDIFPALIDYQNTRSISDFRALCNEIEQFCNAVYVSTTNDDERRIYNKMVEHIKR